MLEAVFLVLQWQVLLALVVGVFAGMVVGALPGISASMAVALLLPLSFGLTPLVALAILAGIQIGAVYGGAITAILLKIPGDPSSVVSIFDGYPMTQKGLAGRALRLSAVSAAVGGVIGVASLILLSPLLARVALAFGPPEIFWVSVFGLASLAVLLGDDPLKGVIACCAGLLIGAVGVDVVTGTERFTFDVLELTNGFPPAIVLAGLFALPVAFEMAERAMKSGLDIASIRAARAKDSMRAWPWGPIGGAWARGSIIGIVVGILPGLGGLAAGLIAYGETKRASHDPSSFGKGNPAGVAVATCATSADHAAAMIPTLTLGVPGSSLAALVLAGVMIHGMEPGPQLFVEYAPTVYGYMLALLLASLAIVPLGGPFGTAVFAQVLRLPEILMIPVIVSLTVVGSYAAENNMFNVYVAFAFGLIGYGMDRLRFPIAPLILALFLGPKIEFNLGVSLTLSRGDWSILWTRPICIALIALTIAVLVYPFFAKTQPKATLSEGRGPE